MTVQTDQQSAEAVTVTRVDWAPVPRVNLLPPEILQARGFRKVQARLAVAVVATMAVAAAGVVWAQAGVNSAQDSLDAATARTTVLQHEQSRYAEVPKVTTALDTAKSARQAAMSQEVLWYRLLTDIALATPANVYLKTLNVNLSSTTGASAPGSAPRSAPGSSAGAAAAGNSGTDPLVPGGIGQVSVTGTASVYPDVAAWLEAIVKVSGLDASTLQSATRADSGTGSGSSSQALTFTSQIVIDSSALSHRYDTKAK